MSRKRILFIDSDDGFVRDVASAAQKRGFDAVVTASSTDGVERARAERPDLIVVSVELAPTNGWSVCTKLKKDDDLKEIPVVLTSSLSTPDTFEKHKKLKTRADEYLLKPYSSEDLLSLASALVGAPDPSSLDEDVVVEDESLSTGDFDMSGLDEEIPVIGDEPLANGLDSSLEASLDATLDSGDEAALDALPANDAPLLDPLTSGDESDLPLGDDLGALPSDLGEFEADSFTADTSDSSTAGLSEELASFDESFANLAAEPDGASLPEATLGEAGLAEVSLGEASLGEFEDEASLDDAAVDAAPVEPDSATEEPALESLEAVPEVAEENADSASFDAAPAQDQQEPVEEAAFNPEEFSFEEAPLDVAAEAAPSTNESSLGDIGEVSGEADFSSELGEAATFAEDPLSAASDFSSVESFGSSVDFGDHARTAELEARVAELEAELEGYKATESTQDQDLERLRLESSQRSREVQDLRDQLREQEKAVHDLKDTESKLNAELSKARDERTRREAAMKALSQKAETMAALGKKFERELLVAREELKAAAALKAKVAELEAAQKAAETAAEAARSELASVKSELDAARLEAAGAQSEKVFLEAQLSDTRESLERVEGEKAELTAKVSSAEDKATSLAAQAQVASERATRAREALRLAVEHLALESDAGAS